MTQATRKSKADLSFKLSCCLEKEFCFSITKPAYLGDKFSLILFFAKPAFLLPSIAAFIGS